MTTIPITPKVAAKRVAVVEEKPARRSSKAPPITPMKIAVCTMGRREERGTRRRFRRQAMSSQAPT